MAILMDRRTWLGSMMGGTAAALGAACSRASRAQGVLPGTQESRAFSRAEDVPVSGEMPDRLRELDRVMTQTMVYHAIPLGSLAVSKDGVVAVKRAYGYREREGKTPLATDALFRPASLDKQIARSAVHQMIDEGRTVTATGETLALGLKVFASLRQAGVIGPELKDVDPRLYDVTIEDLLEHRSGIEVCYPSVEEVRQFFGLTRMPNAIDYLKWHANRPLKSAPGTVQEYNNTAYAMVRHIIEWLTGDWPAYVREHIFEPAGSLEVVRSRTKPSDRDPREVWYDTGATGPSIFPEDNGRLLPTTDGGAISQDEGIAVSAEALVRYLSYWYCASARRLLDDNGNLLTDNGMHIFFGSSDGVSSAMFQCRWTLCNFAVLFNHREERPDIEPLDYTKAIQEVLKGVNWFS